MADGEFGGKTVLITGAGGGLGTALRTLFAARGAALILCDRETAALEGEGWPVHAFDLLDQQSVATAARRYWTAMARRISWSAMPAGRATETMASLSTEVVDREDRLNLTGVIAFVNAFLPAMKARGSGALVFISSVNALAHFGNPAYAAAKAGVNVFARAVAVECGRAGLRANAVCPGSIRTPAWTHRLARDPAVMDKLQRLYPLQRIVEAREVAEAVAFLASARASGITGVSLPVDAGLTAGCLPFIDDVLGGP